jgi:dTDP-glucose 4,6-dehydratase
MPTPHTLLVTGGAGFIGSTFVAQCVERGAQVIVLDKLTYAGHPENLSWITGPGSYELVQGDICNGEAVLQLLKKHQIQAVVNFAAESHVDNSIASPASFIETNIVGTYKMLEAARFYWGSLTGDAKRDFRYLQISTDEVFGSLGETGKFSEKTRMKPNSPYSASKAAGDHLLRAWYKTYGLPTITTNCTNNYGPRQHPEKLIPLMITKALSGQPLPIYGNGQNIRDWIHVEDHCAGVWLALTQGKPGGTYGFGGDAEKNNIEVVDTLCRILGDCQPRPDKRDYAELKTFVQDRPGHDRRYAIDDSKAQTELGFKRKYNFDAGIRQTVDWYLSHTDWAASVLGKQKAA